MKSKITKYYIKSSLVAVAGLLLNPNKKFKYMIENWEATSAHDIYNL